MAWHTISATQESSQTKVSNQLNLMISDFFISKAFIKFTFYNFIIAFYFFFVSRIPKRIITFHYAT